MRIWLKYHYLFALPTLKEVRPIRGKFFVPLILIGRELFARQGKSFGQRKQPQEIRNGARETELNRADGVIDLDADVFERDFSVSAFRCTDDPVKKRTDA